MCCGDASIGIKLLRVGSRTSQTRDWLITHGLSGSSKSFVSRQLLAQVGAIRIRLDIERNRLFGPGSLERSRGKQIYGAADTQRTYARLLDRARVALEAGWPTIVDAARV